MNTVQAQGCPNSIIRWIQNHPGQCLDLMVLCLRGHHAEEVRKASQILWEQIGDDWPDFVQRYKKHYETYKGENGKETE